jgi:tetratricopeptide (TPR) repeat protein
MGAPVQTVPEQAQVPMPGAPQPTQAQAPTAEGGLSEFDKQELLRELDDLRNEGYKVSRLEKIIEDNPGTAWKAFSDFLDDIEKINQSRSRIENLNTNGFPDLTLRKNEISSKTNDPDLLPQITTELNQLETDLKEAQAKKAAAPPPAQAPAPPPQPPQPPQPSVGNQKAEQLEKYIAVGKEAIKQRDYEKALRIFNKTLELDPHNKEIQFFIKKLEAKIAEVNAASGGVPAAPIPPIQPAATSTQIPTAPATPQQPVTPFQPQGQPQQLPMGQGPGGKKKKKKKKKFFSRKSKSDTETPLPPPAPAPAMAPAPAPPSAQAVSMDNGADEGPNTAAEYEALGFNAYINKDYPKALEFFEKVLEIDPSFPNVENLKNECLMRLGKG